MELYETILSGDALGNDTDIDSFRDCCYPASLPECPDAGDNDAVPADVTIDLDGNPRIVDWNRDGVALVDMGAYEVQGSIPAVSEWGLIVLTLLLLTFGTIVLRRRQKERETGCPAGARGQLRRVRRPLWA